MTPGKLESMLTDTLKRIAALESDRCTGVCCAQRRADAITAERVRANGELAAKPVADVVAALDAMEPWQRTRFWGDTPRTRVLELARAFNEADYARFKPELPVELHDMLALDRAVIPAYVRVSVPATAGARFAFTRERLPISGAEYFRVVDALDGHVRINMLTDFPRTNASRVAEIGALRIASDQPLTIRASALEALRSVDGYLDQAITEGNLEIETLDRASSKALYAHELRRKPGAPPLTVVPYEPPPPPPMIPTGDQTKDMIRALQRAYEPIPESEPQP